MKLLLTSGGLMNDSISKALRDLAGRPFQELNLAFIPTAANIEEGNKDWLIADLEDCKRLGFAEVDIVDISALPQAIWQKRLERADILFVGGGNTFHLMHWLHKSGLSEVLPEMLKTRVYVGVSAGSMVATPSIRFADSEKAAAEEIDGKVDDEGLGLVDFLVEPHINNAYFPELTFEYVQEGSLHTDLPIYALDDQSAITVIDGVTTVISEGKWEKFN